MTSLTLLGEEPGGLGGPARAAVVLGLAILLWILVPLGIAIKQLRGQDV